MIAVVHCHLSIIEQTVSILKDAGHTGQECLVLWLAKRMSHGLEVREAICPQQIAGMDFFQIPSQSMQAIMDLLKQKGLMIAAQIHTHPFEAYHSMADDRWAIIRHIGALSFVVPYFAQFTDAENFLQNSALFVLDSQNRWIYTTSHRASKLCQVHN